MKITKMLASPGLTGFYFDDQKAIKAASPYGFTYKRTLTPDSAVISGGINPSAVLAAAGCLRIARCPISVRSRDPSFSLEFIQIY